MAVTIDAHQHFWDLSLSFDYRWLSAQKLAKIHQNFLPEDLEPLLKASGIQKSIFVQTQHNVEENRWALELAQQNPFIAGVVGWVNLASPDCERQVASFKSDPLFVGVRHITQDEPDDNFIITDEVLRGLKVLEKYEIPFDLLFYVKHLKHVSRIVRACPNLPLVIDHLSKPEIKAHKLDGWKTNFRLASTFPNVYCKLSGMVTEADWQTWTPTDFRDYVDLALEYFGPDRCMFGSDWPVCELAASYDQVVQLVSQLISHLTPSEKAKIFGETAAKFYRLKV